MSNSYSWEAVLSAKDDGLTATIKRALGAIDGIDSSFSKFEGSAGKASDGFGEVGDAAKKSGGLLSKFKSAVSFGSIFSLAQQGMSALTGGIGSIISETASASDAMDKFKSTMEFAGFTKKQTSTASAAMKQYADQTVYDLGDVLNTTSQLAANGVGDFQGLTKAAGNLNAVAGGNADTFKSVAMVMTQTAGAGKLTTENWNQLADAIPGASGILQAAMKKNGAYTGNFRDAMAAGQITADEFNKAISQTGMTKAAKDAAKSTTTFEGAIGNLQAAFVSAGMDIVNRFKKPITDAISAVGNAVSSVNFDKVFSGIGKMAEPFEMAIENIKNQFNALQKVDLSNLSQVFGGIGSVINKVWGILGGFSNMLVTGVISTLQSVGDGFKKAFSSKDIKKVFGEINGVLDDFGTVVSVVVGQVGSFLSSIDWATIFNTVKIAISGVLGVLKPVAGLVAKAFMSKPVLAFGAGLAKVVNAALKSDAIKVMAAAVVGAIAAFKGMQAIQAASAAIKAFSASTKIATAVETAFNAVMNANPVMLIVTAIAALVAGLVYFFTQTKTGQKAWAAFVKFLQQAWEGLVKIAKATWDAVTKAFSGAAEGVKQGWNNVGTFFTGLWSGIKDGVSTAWQGITSALTGAWTAIQSAATSVFSALGSFFSGVWNGIVSVATALWNTFGASLTSIWTSIVNVASGVWNLLKTVVMAPILLIIDLVTGNFTQLQADLTLIWNSITSAAGQIWDGLKTYFSGVIDFIKTYFVSAWNALSSFLSSLWSGIASTAKSIWNGVKSFFAGLWSAIKSTAVSAWNGLKSGVVAIFNGIVNGAKSVFNGLKSFLSGLWSGVKSAAVNAWNGIKSGIVSAAKAVINGVKTAWNAFKNLPSTVIGWIRGGFKALANIDLGAAGRAIMNSFLSGLKGVWKGVQDFVGGIGDWIRKHKGPISYDKKLLIPAGNAIMNGLNAGLSDRFKIVRKNVSGMAGALADSFNPHALSTALAGINGQLNSGLNASVAQDLDLSNHMTIEVPVLVDGKQVAKATAKPMMAEQQRLTKMTNRLNGKVN
ncbi:tape measure protein [Lacticaseibacillus mingshuiensis]|uniref:tape measure protein n=1 Tax=Lacticaseibacillus mingshuiensis TaxID=2799574 RepID=UPI0019512B19|nr:tape measure protein [Lacticaseibacillus mingshuiensis]